MGRAARPEFTRFVCGLSIGWREVVKYFVRRAAAERLVCPVLVVPLGNQIQFAPPAPASRERNDCQQAHVFLGRCGCSA